MARRVFSGPSVKTSIKLDGNVMEAIANYRHDQRIETLSETVELLLRDALHRIGYLSDGPREGENGCPSCA